ncbi:hypothetical protein CEXT_302821 [Caerostris extrusa]|uniref:Uncharacterized protein n=1 Tax=Caerostris extrusa TaxID=172846 RepID=A0AAV4XUY8_CAEEX|nr:hypothetical protein CEXT_302821 [Caerostris extrusa]
MLNELLYLQAPSDLYDKETIVYPDQLEFQSGAEIPTETRRTAQREGGPQVRRHGQAHPCRHHQGDQGSRSVTFSAILKSIIMLRQRLSVLTERWKRTTQKESKNILQND